MQNTCETCNGDKANLHLIFYLNQLMKKISKASCVNYYNSLEFNYNNKSNVTLDQKTSHKGQFFKLRFIHHLKAE